MFVWTENFTFELEQIPQMPPEMSLSSMSMKVFLTTIPEGLPTQTAPRLRAKHTGVFAQKSFREMLKHGTWSDRCHVVDSPISFVFTYIQWASGRSSNLMFFWGVPAGRWIRYNIRWIGALGWIGWFRRMRRLGWVRRNDLPGHKSKTQVPTKGPWRTALVMSTCHSYNWKTFNSCTQAWPTWARGGTATGAGLLTLNRVWKSSDKQSIKEVWVYWKLLIYRGDSWVAGRVSRRLMGQEFSCFQEGSTMSQRPHSHQKILRKEGAMCVNRRVWEWHIFISTCFSRRFIGPKSRDSWPLRSWPSSADLQQGSGCPGCHLLLTPCWDPGKSHAPPGAKDCGCGL